MLTFILRRHQCCFIFVDNLIYGEFLWPCTGGHGESLSQETELPMWAFVIIYPMTVNIEMPERYLKCARR